MMENEDGISLRAFSSEVSGVWNIEGVVDKSLTRDDRNSGTVQLEPLGQIYQASWLTAANNRLGLMFATERCLFGGWGASHYRLSLFQLQEGGSLSEHWVLPTSWGNVSQEVVCPDLVEEFEGLYDVENFDAKTGRTRIHHISMHRNGEYYQLGSSQFPNIRGLGLRLGNWLVANWCAARDFGVLAYELSGKEAHGSWLSAQNMYRNQEVWTKVG